MNAETTFMGAISRLRRRVIFRRLGRLLLWACAFFLAGYTLFAIIPKSQIYGDNHHGLWVAALCVISLIAAIGAFKFEGRAFQSFLVEIDARLRLGDSISTAFEYRQAGHQSVFLDLLMQDAASKLRRLSSREIFPGGFSRLHFFLILATLSAVVCFFAIDSGQDFNPVIVDQGKIEKALKLVQDFVESRPAADNPKAAGQISSVDRNIEQLRKTLNQSATTPEHLFASLNRHRREVQAQQMSQADRLGARLDKSQFRNMPILDSADLQGLNANQLDKLKRLLDQAFNDRIPDALQKDLESLQELFRLEKLLTRIIEEFHEGHSRPHGRVESGRSQSSASLSADELSKKSDGSLQPDTGAQNPSNAENGVSQIPDRTRSASSNSNGFDMPGKRRLSQGTFPRAGSARSDDRGKPGSEIDKATGLGVREKLPPAQVRQYLVRIRTLGATGESKLNEEEIIRPYQQEIEGVLKKEDIPLNYRDYIRNYFLSIGLEPAEISK